MFQQTVPLFELLKTVGFFVFMGFFLRNFFFIDFKNAYTLRQWTYTVMAIIGLVSVIIKGYTFMDILGFIAVFFLMVITTPLIEGYLEDKFGFEFD